MHRWCLQGPINSYHNLFYSFTGQKCQDPGYPAGGRKIATSFADNSIVRFECTENGYTLSHNDPLVCQGMLWNNTATNLVPECIGKPLHIWASSRENLSRYILGPHRETTCLQGFMNNKGADQPAHPRSQFSAIVICLLESIISRLATN